MIICKLYDDDDEVAMKRPPSQSITQEATKAFVAQIRILPQDIP